MKRHHVILGVLGALALAPTASAYNLGTANGNTIKWGSNTLTFNVASADWDDTVRRDIINDAVSLWYANPSNFYFTTVEDDDSWAFKNNENEIAWTTSIAILGGSPAIAYTTWDTNTGEIFEADIYMNANVSYTNSTDKSDLWEYGGRNRSGQTTMVHELGHAMGLGHVSSLYGVMGTDWTHIHVNGSTATAYPGEDACAGAIEMYDEYEPYEDLSVAHWRRTGASGEYSVHSRTRILDSSGNALTQYTCDNEPCYYLRKGTTYRGEVTFENSGGDAQSATHGLYLSTNSTISTWDTPITRMSFEVEPDTPLTTSVLFTPSSSTQTGWYWVGVVTDVSNTVSETREDNNATYIAKVYIY